MEFFFNELSLHNQFNDLNDFYAATDEFHKCRSLINQFGFKLYCTGTIGSLCVAHETDFAKAICDHPDKNKKSAIMAWITKYGPFWEDQQSQTYYDTFSIENGSDTDIIGTSLVEAAKRKTDNFDTNSISYNHSNYTYTPIKIIMGRHSDISTKTVEIGNYWNLSDLEKAFKSSAIAFKSTVSSWESLHKWSKNCCKHLHIADTAMDKIIRKKHPFSPILASNIQGLLEILNDLMMNKSVNTLESINRVNEIESKYFGSNHKFKPESDTNKREFKLELTFKHPEGGNDLFCHFHGRTDLDTFRIHFNWPIKSPETKLYVVYIGPKITKS